MSEILLASICAVFYLAVKLTDGKPNRIQYYYKWYCYYLYGLIVSSVLCLIFLWKGRSLQNLPKCISWLRPMSKFHGISWHLENSEVLERSGRAVIVSNHQSSLDIIGMIHASPAIRSWIPTCKKEMMFLGPIGLLCHLIGSVFIDRTNPRQAYRNLEAAVKLMEEKELKIWLFPEGTRNLQRALLPFRRGAFKIAVRARAPILPVVFSPYYFAYEDRCVFQNDGHIIMRCLDPVPTEGLTEADIPDLIKRLHRIMSNEYETLSKEVLLKFPGASQALAKAK